MGTTLSVIESNSEKEESAHKRMKIGEEDISLDGNYSASLIESNSPIIPTTDTFVRINKKFLETRNGYLVDLLS